MQAEAIVANLAFIRSRMAQAALKRKSSVDHTKPIVDILAAYSSGQRCFGENYIHELIDKVPQLPADIEWHFIGQLQSNKIKQLPLSIAAVESVDSQKKADLLDRHFASRSPKLKVFVQVNTSKEESKGGIEVNACLGLVKHILAECTSLEFSGLMCIGLNGSTNAVNPDFKVCLYLHWMNDQCLSDLAGQIMKECSLKTVGLSMGMSDDFCEAIEQGATNVRVGSKIFGQRLQKNSE